MYQPKKANILADTLSKSKTVELDAVFSIVKGDQEKEVVVLTRSSIVVTEEGNI